MSRSVLISITTLVLLVFDSPKEKSHSLPENAHLEKFKRLYTLTSDYVEQGTDTDTTLIIARETLDLANLIQNKKEIFMSAFLLGRAYNHSGKYKEAENLLNHTLLEINSEQYFLEYLSVLFELGRTKFLLLNYRDALSLFLEIEKISHESGLSKWEAIALDAIGAIYYVKSDFEAALKCHMKSLKLYQNIGDTESTCGLFYSVGADYNCLSVYDQAIAYYLRAVNQSEQNNDIQTLAMSLHAIGLTYQEIKNYKQSVNYNIRALYLSDQIRNDYLTSSIYSNLGQIKFALADYDSALYYFRKGLEIDTRLDFRPGMASALDNIGYVYVRLNDFQGSLTYFKKAYGLLSGIDEKWRKTKILGHLGQYHLRKSDFKTSYNYLIESLKSSQFIKAQDLILENLNTFSEYYARQNNFKLAYDYMLKYLHLSDSLITSGSHTIAAMQLRYEMDKQEKQKQILNDKIYIQGLALEHAQLERWFSLMSVLIFSLISFWSYSRYFVKRRANIVLEKRVKRAIKKQEQQKKIIFHQSSLSSLGELAAGMAHEISQPLQDLKLCTEYIDFNLRENSSADSLYRDSIDEIYQDIERIKIIIDHVRLFSSQQKNNVMEKFQIKPVILNALTMISRQFAKKDIELKIDLEENIGQIIGNPFKLEQMLINLLANAKDALLEKENRSGIPYQKRIEITTKGNGAFITLCVSDNGIGLKPNEVKQIFLPFFTTKKLGKGTGLGLSIVREIAEEFGAEKKVSSQYMKGTVFQFKIPAYLKDQHDSALNTVSAMIPGKGQGPVKRQI